MPGLKYQSYNLSLSLFVSSLLNIFNYVAFDFAEKTVTLRENGRATIDIPKLPSLRIENFARLANVRGHVCSLRAAEIIKLSSKSLSTSRRSHYLT